MTRFQISKNSSLPLHIQLLDDLRHKIIVGDLKPHDQLPGEWELVEELDISRATIQRAWQSAQEESLIYRVAGKGTFVAAKGERAARLSVGFVIPEYRGMFAMKMLGGAERVLRKLGCSVRFASTERDVAEENRVLREMLEDGVNGLMLVPVRGPLKNRLLASPDWRLPVVLMDRPLNGLVLSCISSHNYAGGQQAMQHLMELGHRDILFVARPHLDLWSVSERYRAYQDGLRQIGVEPRPAFLIGSDTEMSTCEAHLGEDQTEIEPLIALLRSPQRPTAIFAVNDWMAIKAQRAVQQAGLRIPDDVSLVGFDDMDIAQYQTPPLTTVAQDAALMGAEAARRLLTLIDDHDTHSILTLLPTCLIVRESTGRPPG